jgi:hypothetical protein
MQKGMKSLVGNLERKRKTFLVFVKMDFLVPFNYFSFAKLLLSCVSNANKLGFFIHTLIFLGEKKSSEQKQTRRGKVMAREVKDENVYLGRNCQYDIPCL